MTRAEEQALKAYPDFDSVTPIRRACYQEGYEQAEKDLGWISVKDRLPEDDGWYLTCVRVEHLGNTPQIVCPFFFWKKYKRWEDADGLYNGKIDYWMPIPKLPNKDEK